VLTNPPVTYVTSLDDTGNIGWAWHIPLREKTSVGLILPRESLKILKQSDETWEGFFLRQCEQVYGVNRLLEKARFCHGSVRLIRDYSYRSTQLTGKGFYLIGDAAAFVDPIFSIGVLLGMYSAYSAAWAIDASFRNPAYEAKNRTLFTSQFQGRLEVVRSLALPHYTSGEQVSELAKAAIKFERKDSQELIYAASSLTDRSDNLGRLVGNERKNKIYLSKFCIF
jgi:flavin-dependent dehydrogenase